MDNIDFEALEDELAQIDPEELRNLLQLLSENVPADTEPFTTLFTS